MAEIELKVGGMACEGCASAVKNAVERIAPAAGVAVDLPAKRVRISGDAPRGAIEAAIVAAGYEILK